MSYSTGVILGFVWFSELKMRVHSSRISEVDRRQAYTPAFTGHSTGSDPIPFLKKEKNTGEPKDVTKDYQLIVDGEICSEGHHAPLLTSPAHLSASCEHAVASIMSDSAKPGTEACQAPLSMGFSRQGHWSGFPCLPPQDLPDPEIEPMCHVAPALQTDS